MPSVAAQRCGYCLRFFPVVFILAVVGWSYYAYVVRLCFELKAGPSDGEKSVYLIFYHILLAMFLWSWAKVAVTKPAPVPQEYHLPEDTVRELELADPSGPERSAILEKFAQRLDLEMRAVGNGIRYCEKCRCIKPDRAHHCSTCGVCVLKMDHHCPWINNCVGFSTYKYFILFLFYAQLYCVFVAATDAQYFARFWMSVASLMSASEQSDFHVMFVFIISLMFGLAVLALFSYHIFLLKRNNSTQESLRVPLTRAGAMKDAFDMGAKQNLREIFGDHPILWCLPVWSSKGDGVHFTTRYQPTFHDATSSGTSVAATESNVASSHNLESSSSTAQSDSALQSVKVI